MLGRAYAYALAAAGERGVMEIVEAIRTELRITLALMGLPSIAALRTFARPVKLTRTPAPEKPL